MNTSEFFKFSATSFRSIKLMINLLPRVKPNYFKQILVYFCLTKFFLTLCWEWNQSINAIKELCFYHCIQSFSFTHPTQKGSFKLQNSPGKLFFCTTLLFIMYMTACINPFNITAFWLKENNALKERKWSKTDSCCKTWLGAIYINHVQNTEIIVSNNDNMI